MVGSLVLGLSPVELSALNTDQCEHLKAGCEGKSMKSVYITKLCWPPGRVG